VKLITAIIQPFMLDKLARALRKQPITGYTAAEVQGSGADLLQTPAYLAPRVRVDIAVLDDQVELITEVIVNTVSTHQEGDGVIFVSPLEEVINIQTMLRGEEALQPLVADE
jgi:nitrogen regulatory protein PII